MDTENITVEFKSKPTPSKKLLPLILMAVVIILDQVTKQLVVKNIPLTYPVTIGAQFFGDFLRIIHVCNPGIAFSIGESWSLVARAILFRFVPVFVIIMVLIVYFKNEDFNQLQRWAIMGIAGGGTGNLIDRFFRKEGVVDFIDVKFYNILGMERWPTFNVADATVVVCGIILVISFLFTVKNSSQKKGIK
ncbi:signal peptidase II [Treponema pectinovorum]|uniref:signal peptidase II n=1 Tax=Treponema pectinovorum TaxID=164 RepID=UPI0011CAC45A|nr:signal peptidase II [Treponema pectinovorum]